MKERTKVILLITSLALLMAVVTVDMENKIHHLEKENHNLKTDGEEKDYKIDSLQFELDTLHTLNWDNIAYWMDHFRIEYEDVVRRQIELETANLTSDICLENNNLFGMREPRVRPTTALGTKRGHAYYENYVESIKDYALWQRYTYNGGNYYHFLAIVGYAEAEYYIQTLKRL